MPEACTCTAWKNHAFFMQPGRRRTKMSSLWTILSKRIHSLYSRVTSAKLYDGQGPVYKSLQ